MFIDFLFFTRKKVMLVTLSKFITSEDISPRYMIGISIRKHIPCSTLGRTINCNYEKNHCTFQRRLKNMTNKTAII